MALAVFLITVALFAFWGYRAGLLRALVRTLGVVAGYVLAWLFTAEVATWLGDMTPLTGLLRFVAAALGLFAAGSLGLSVLAALFLSREEARWPLPGMAFGGVMGMLVGLVLVWTLDLWQARQAATVPVADAQVADPLSRLAGQTVGTVVEQAVLAQTGGSATTAKVAGQLLRDPAGTVRQVNSVTQSRALQQLINEPRSRQLLAEGRLQALRRDPAFQQLLRESELLNLAVTSGLVDPRAGEASAETQVAALLSEVYQKGHNLRRDPRAQAILADPSLRKAIEQRDMATLMTHPKLVELLAIANRVPVTLESDAEGTPASGVASPTIYRWQGEDGTPTFSDRKPQEIPQP